MKKQAYKKVYFWDGCCTQASGERKIFRRKDSEQSKQENSAAGQKGEENGQSRELPGDERRAKAFGKSKQVQSSELRCQEDGNGPCSCCYCSVSEGSCSAEKTGAGGPQFTLLPLVGFSGECPKGSTFP